MPLRPFFPYFGSKYKSAGIHPKPYHDTIIEPFAGSACYSLFHYRHKVILNDLSEEICGIWAYLINVTEEEFKSLPNRINHIDEIKGPQEVKWFIGEWFGVGKAEPIVKPTSLQRRNSDNGIINSWNIKTKFLLASQLKSIRHWKITRGDFKALPDIEACWFIDPPYRKASRSYLTPKFTEYDELAKWSMNRKGMVIVCEKEGADWLPFKPFKIIKCVNGHTREVVYYHNCFRFFFKDE